MYGVRRDHFQVVLTKDVESTVRQTLLEHSDYSQACLDLFIRFDIVKSFKFEHHGFPCSNGRGFKTIGFVIFDGKRHYAVTVNHGAPMNSSESVYGQTSPFYRKKIGEHFFSTFKVSASTTYNSYNNNSSLLDDIESDQRFLNLSSDSTLKKSLPLVTLETPPGYVPVPMIEKEVLSSISDENSMDFTIISLTKSLAEYRESQIHFDPITEGTKLLIDTMKGSYECCVDCVSAVAQIDENRCLCGIVLLRNVNLVQRGDSGCVYLYEDKLCLVHLGRITYELEEKSKKLSFNVAVPLRNEWDFMKKAIICRNIKLGRD